MTQTLRDSTLGFGFVNAALNPCYTGPLRRRLPGSLGEVGRHRPAHGAQATFLAFLGGSFYGEDESFEWGLQGLGESYVLASKSTGTERFCGRWR